MFLYRQPALIYTLHASLAAQLNAITSTDIRRLRNDMNDAIAEAKFWKDGNLPDAKVSVIKPKNWNDFK